MRFDAEQTIMTEDKTSEQKYLELINREYNPSEAYNILDKIEWDFKDFNTQYFTHKFHSYPARFIPHIPLTFIRLFTKDNETVVDPFCGCGTTLVEAFLNNRYSIGNDFNPLAALITKVKTTLINNNEIAYLNERLARIKSNLDLDNSKIDERLRNMPRRKISKLFDRKTVLQLEAIREILVEIREDEYTDIYDFGRVALSSTIWSLVEHGTTDVTNSFLKKVTQMENEMKKTAKVVESIPNITVINGDARKLEVESESADLIITSPPYVNALDYYRVHMYNMYWLDMDFNAFKRHEIGAHSRFINNRFRLFSEYLGDMLRSMIEMNRILKQDKLCVIVVGNSSLEYELIESHKFFSEISNKIGFKTIKTIFRNIDKTKKYTSADIGKIDDEFILIMQKIENVNVSPENDVFIAEIVAQQLIQFREKLKHSQGTSIRGRKPTKERLLENIDKIDDAIDRISKDILMKLE